MSEDNPLDMELSQTMDAIFEVIKEMPDNKDTDDQLRLRVVAHNLRALAQVFLIAIDHHDSMEINPLQVALGLLGTSDWIMSHIPEMDNEIVLPPL